MGYNGNTSTDVLDHDDLNFSRYPDRGIVTEIAREVNRSQSAVWQAYHRGNPTIRQMVLERARGRRNRTGERR